MVTGEPERRVGECLQERALAHDKAATGLQLNATPTRLLLSLNLAAMSVSSSNPKILALAVLAPLGSYDARGAPVSGRPPIFAEAR